tara:strand:+ start:3003 stop:3440 length:438 start_codon:yes stop_codon:yes gene_type:complete
MKKILIIGGLIVAGIVIVFLLSGDEPLSPSPDTTLPTGADDTFDYKPNKATKVADQVYALTNLEEDETFSVVYYEFDGSYAAALLKEPLGESRQALEDYLKVELALDEDELCSLPLFVGVPEDVNSYFAGLDLKLSFCEGSIDLN